ncbi:MAG TPA: TolC family protein [Kofleriaceae bacterium]
MARSAWLSVILVLATPAHAEDAALPSPLRVADVMQIAKTGRAEVSAARSRAKAAARRPALVSALDDPEIYPSLDHVPYKLDGANWSVTIEQRFPLSHVRGNREHAAEADALRELAGVERTGLDVELDAAQAFWMLAELRERAKIVNDEHALADQMVKAATTRYANGNGMQADVLRAQLELDKLDGEREAIAADVRAAEAMLDTSLARSPDAPIPDLDATVADTEPAAASAATDAALAKRPELRAGSAEVARAEAEVSVMDSMYAPMGMIRTGPAYTMFDGAGWMVMVGVSIPLWRGKLDAGVDEARSMRDMAEADLQAMRTMVRGEAAAARERVEAARLRYVSLRDRVVPRANEAIAANLSAYAAGQTPLVGVIESAQALWDAQRDLAMARAQLGLAWARLARATAQETP